MSGGAAVVCVRASGRLFAAATLLALIAVAGCKPEAVAAPVASRVADSRAKADAMSASVDSINYMHDRGVHFKLYDLSTTPPTPIGDSLVNFLASGGDKNCCLALPPKWHAGIKVRLDWFEEDRQQIYPERYSRELEIPHYDAPGDLYVVFYPKNEVELVVSPGEPGSADWLGRIKQTPWDLCVATYGRKTCRVALPKTFDAKGSRGFCTYAKSKDFPKENYNGDDLCRVAMHECMKDYEDEPFCKGVLWGPEKK